MIPGPDQILTCPFCGFKMKIPSLISGNGFGAELWSDGKMVALMPEISLVRKCHECGNFFLLTRQDPVYDEDDEDRYLKSGRSYWEKPENEIYYAGEGHLSFPALKKAWKQLKEEGFEDIQEEESVRLMLFHSFNDYYFVGGNNEEFRKSERFREYCSGNANKLKKGKNRVVNEADLAFFRENVEWLLENYDSGSNVDDNLTKAEILLEIGNFSRAEEFLNCLSTEDNEYLKRIVDEIRKKIQEKDSKLFIIDKGIY